LGFTEGAALVRRLGRIGVIAVIVLVALFYLQFGLQALVHFWLQGALTLFGAAALAWGAARKVKGSTAALVVLVGTVPVFILHGVMTVVEPGELPFLVGSVPVPLVAGLAWLWGRLARKPVGEVLV
jgi:hypothetical protein